MSRIGNSIIKLPQDTTCSFENNILSVKGKLGTATLLIDDMFTINQQENEVHVLPKDEKNKSNPLWGTTRAHVANTLNGVCEGFSKQLELSGTGFRASVSGSILKLQLGYSHDIDYKIPKDIKIIVEKQTTIKINGSDKQQVGMVASKIKSFRPPEPYKGKGIKEKGEYTLRKEGKKK